MINKYNYGISYNLSPLAWYKKLLRKQLFSRDRVLYSLIISCLEYKIVYISNEKALDKLTFYQKISYIKVLLRNTSLFLVS